MNLKYAKRSEDTEQISVFEWAKWQQGRWPDLKWLYHTPNGGTRNQKEAVKLHQMGVMPGVPDIHLPVSRGDYRDLWIEMKFGRNKRTENQREFMRKMVEEGSFVCTCYSATCATWVIAQYLRLDWQTPEKAFMPIDNNIELHDRDLQGEDF